MIDHSKGKASYTISETISETINTSSNNSIHLVLTLKDPVSKKVNKLLIKTAETIESLPKEYQHQVIAQVNSWETCFFENYKIEKDDLEQKRAAKMLLVLNLYLEDVMGNYAINNDFEKVKWLIISNKIKKIVAPILPVNVNLEAFIEADRNNQREMQLRYHISLEIKEIMEIINDLFDALEDKIYEDADKLLDEMETAFKNLKSDLIDLNLNQKNEIEKLHSSLDAITESVSSIYEDLKMGIEKIKMLDTEINVVDNLLHNLRDELESLINKI